MHPQVSTFTRLFLIVAACLSLAGIVGAQPRDFLTEPESELIRYHQQLDKRIEVFIKAIDRRFAIINGVAQAKSKKLDRDEPEWGELPTGSRKDLFSDIAGILDSAISNIDGVSTRDEKNPMISRSLRKLAAASNGYAAQLNTLGSQTKDADELAAIERALEYAQQIVEAAKQLPAPSTDKKKKNDP